MQIMIFDLSVLYLDCCTCESCFIFISHRFSISKFEKENVFSKCNLSTCIHFWCGRSSIALRNTKIIISVNAVKRVQLTVDLRFVRVTAIWQTSMLVSSLQFKGCGMGPWLVLVSPCFRENVVATCKIGSFLSSLDDFLQKNVIVLFFGNQISKWRSFEKKGYFWPTFHIF